MPPCRDNKTKNEVNHYIQRDVCVRAEKLWHAGKQGVVFDLCPVFLKMKFYRVALFVFPVLMLKMPALSTPHTNAPKFSVSLNAQLSSSLLDYVPRNTG